MSRIPKIKDSKYNNDSKFAWVDSQWEKLMTEQKELKDKISELEHHSGIAEDYILDLEEGIKEVISTLPDSVEKTLLKNLLGNAKHQ